MAQNIASASVHAARHTGAQLAKELLKDGPDNDVLKFVRAFYGYVREETKKNLCPKVERVPSNIALLEVLSCICVGDEVCASAMLTFQSDGLPIVKFSTNSHHNDPPTMLQLQYRTKSHDINTIYVEYRCEIAVSGAISHTDIVDIELSWVATKNEWVVFQTNAEFYIIGDGAHPTRSIRIPLTFRDNINIPPPSLQQQQQLLQPWKNYFREPINLTQYQVQFTAMKLCELLRCRWVARAVMRVRGADALREQPARVETQRKLDHVCLLEATAIPFAHILCRLLGQPGHTRCFTDDQTFNLIHDYGERLLTFYLKIDMNITKGNLISELQGLINNLPGACDKKARNKRRGVTVDTLMSKAHSLRALFELLDRRLRDDESFEIFRQAANEARRSSRHMRPILETFRRNPSMYTHDDHWLFKLVLSTPNDVLQAQTYFPLEFIQDVEGLHTELRALRRAIAEGDANTLNVNFGISKPCCALCHMLLRAHGVTPSRGTHGCLCVDWKFPKSQDADGGWSKFSVFLGSAAPLYDSLTIVQQTLVRTTISEMGSLRPKDLTILGVAPPFFDFGISLGDISHSQGLLECLPPLHLVFYTAECMLESVWLATGSQTSVQVLNKKIEEDFVKLTEAALVDELVGLIVQLISDVATNMTKKKRKWCLKFVKWCEDKNNSDTVPAAEEFVKQMTQPQLLELWSLGGTRQKLQLLSNATDFTIVETCSGAKLSPAIPPEFKRTAYVCWSENSYGYLA